MRPFSTASIRLAAAELAQSPPGDFQSVLDKLQSIDSQIDLDLKHLHADLNEANDRLRAVEADLQDEQTKSKELQTRAATQEETIQMLTRQLRRVHSIKKDNGESDDEGSRDALEEVDAGSLVVLLKAREEAYRSQGALVKRLKKDNRELRDNYDRLLAKYNRAGSEKEVETESAHGSSNQEEVDEITAISEKHPNVRERSAQRARTPVVHHIRPDHIESYKENIPDPSANNVNKNGKVARRNKLQHLSLRVKQAGRDANHIAEEVEKRLQMTSEDVQEFQTAWRRFSSGVQGMEGLSSESRVSTPRKGSKAVQDEFEDTFEINVMEVVKRENERLNLAGTELMKTLALQQTAHENLRATVLELTKELERIEPEGLKEMKSWKDQLDKAKKDIVAMEEKLERRDKTISALNREIKKVTAEYKAVSIAHSYSNAELSKIRARDKKISKLERQRIEGQSRHGGGSDRHHHWRNHHFR